MITKPIYVSVELHERLNVYKKKLEEENEYGIDGKEITWNLVIEMLLDDIEEMAKANKEIHNIKTKTDEVLGEV